MSQKTEDSETFRMYKPNPKVLFDLLEICQKYNLNEYEFKAELEIALELTEKSAKGPFKDIQDTCVWMQATLNAKYKIFDKK